MLTDMLSARPFPANPVKEAAMTQADVQSMPQSTPQSMPQSTPHADILTSLDAAAAARWAREPQNLAHTLHQSPLFQMDALASLIDGYPPEHYSLVYMGEQGQRRFWREGETGGMKGAEVIDAISKGRMWLNLRNVKTVDRRFNGLVEQIFAEISRKVPGFKSYNHGCGILISSPKAQVYYHADLPGQALWQIHGKKRVFVYPSKAPFIRPEHLEGIALFGVEVDMPYDKSYDTSAEVFDIGPGEALHWPLNAPHRVENHDCLNVSMTLEYWNEDIRRLHMVNVANGILRHRMGLNPKSRAISGPGFLAKAVLQKSLKNSRWVKKENAARRPVDFRLDRARPGQILDLPAAMAR